MDYLLQTKYIAAYITALGILLSGLGIEKINYYEIQAIASLLGRSVGIMILMDIVYFKYNKKVK